jgi:uncharacterized protein (TIGR02246 family)
MSLNGRIIPILAAGAMAALLSVTLAVPRAQAQSAAPTQQEQAAIDLVKQWFAAWQAGDADKMASYMSDKVEFRGIPSQPIRTGRAAFKQDTGRFIQLKPQITVTEAFAVGGVADTAVLIKRIDKITLNGQRRTIPLAAVFRVHDGKIEEWLDVPLVQLGNVAPPRAGIGVP